ncbi:MAG: FtsQ-type POTRA domain-containing protein [Clostridia bacterium]|nr:FtsQ-type POTRA domain-containing protein [Clostridia bacterium]
MAVKKRKKKKIIQIRKNSRVAKVIAVLALIAVTLFILMLTPLFDAKHLVVRSADGGKPKQVTAGEVKQAIEYKSTENIYQLSIRKGEEKLEQHPYVKKAVIKRKIPSTIQVTLTERVPVSYVAFGNAVVLLDEEGYLLEQQGKKPKKLPAVTGISVKTLKIGDSLKERNVAKANAYTALYEKLAEYELAAQTTEIDIKDPNQIKCVLGGNKEIHFGDGYQLDYKMRMLQVAVEELGPSEAGTITLTVEGKAIFTPKES